MSSVQTTVLTINPAAEAERITGELRHNVRHVFKRHGVVVGVSGGVDSATVLALCASAFGPQRVSALLLPDKDSSPDSARLAQLTADRFGVTTTTIDLTAGLEAFGCYRRRDEAIQSVVPNYDPATCKVKIVLPGDLLERDTLNVFSVVVIHPDGHETRKVLPPAAYLRIVAASNMKQRSRMMALYTEAESLNYAVVGTANKNEHDQGFFVKHGDAGVDIQAIGHLYKSQVYQLAEYLDVPDEIRRRPPTSDTYSAECTQEEFFFRLPFTVMDQLWHAHEAGTPIAEVAASMHLDEAAVLRAFRDFERKRQTTAYLRMEPVFLSPAPSQADARP
ncbi:MAG TPA: NAD(+) synthase [Ktedonobacterales bacterium]|nr:NAD(+) synthase [Ktedonobacterales bacterium]